MAPAFGALLAEGAQLLASCPHRGTGERESCLPLGGNSQLPQRWKSQPQTPTAPKRGAAHRSCLPRGLAASGDAQLRSARGTPGHCSPWLPCNL